jgi:hypothetical protein
MGVSKSRLTESHQVFGFVVQVGDLWVTAPVVRDTGDVLYQINLTAARAFALRYPSEGGALKDAEALKAGGFNRVKVWRLTAGWKVAGVR